MPLAALKVYFLTWTLSSGTSVMTTTRVPLLTDGSPCDNAVLSAVGASSHLISIATLHRSHFYLVCSGWGVRAPGSGITCRGINNRLRCLFIFHKYMDNCWFVINSVNMNGIFFFFSGKIKRWLSQYLKSTFIPPSSIPSFLTSQDLFSQISHLPYKARALMFLNYPPSVVPCTSLSTYYNCCSITHYSFSCLMPVSG